MFHRNTQSDGSFGSVRSERRRRRPFRRKGTVLIAVVVIVMLLSLAAYQYMLTMETEHMAAAISGDRLQAQQAAYSARDLLSLILEMPRDKRDALGGVVDNPLYFGGDPTAFADATLSSGSSMTSSISANTSTAISSEATSIDPSSGLLNLPPFGSIAYAMPQEDETNQRTFSTSSSSMSSATPFANSSNPSNLGAVPTRYGAKNESAKLHLLRILQLEIDQPGDGVAALMQLPGMDEETADSILDWIDDDDEPRANGAESEFYATLTRPMAPRNNLPPDIDELLFVKGVRPLTLFGFETEDPFDPLTMNSQSSSSIGSGAMNSTSATSTMSNQFGLDDSLAKPRPWSELLTVYSAERNESYTGRPRQFLNSKKLNELHNKLSEMMPAEWADFLVLYRQYGPSELEESSEQNSESESVTIDFEKPAKFFIENPLDLIGIAVTIPANKKDEDSKAQTIESPFGDDVATITPEFVDWLDKITLIPERRIVGRVNVNVAPREVLMALPGMTETIVEAIMSDREEASNSMSAGGGGMGAGMSAGMVDDPFGSSEPPERLHPIWLLTEGIVDAETMRTLWPHVTCGGDVYHADVWGYVDDRSPTVHFETVLDASLKRCRPVYYRELDASTTEVQIKAPAELMATLQQDVLP